jgi:prepilin-type N-terminal cleavage/methylation domain-containing protein
MSQAQKGYTLIELLVVMSIFSLLTSVVFNTLQEARTKANTSKARADMSSFIRAVVIAQGESRKTLMTMSANGGSTVPNCSSCVPSCTGDIRSTGSVCYTNWVAVLNGVQNNSSGVIGNITFISRDPWGSPYLVDENQGEAGNCTLLDTIKSVGKDGVNGTSDDVASPTAIPLSGTCP